MKNQIKKRDNFVSSFWPKIWDSDFFTNFFTSDVPAVNLAEKGDQYTLDVSVPGYDKDEISVTVDGNMLHISAKKEEKEETKDDEQIIRQEFKTSSFERSFTLPENVDTVNIAAKQKDGVLKLTLPKLEKAKEDKFKKIEIK